MRLISFDSIQKKLDKLFEDGTHIIYVNGSYKDDSGSALGDLIHDFFCDNPADMKHHQLAQRVSFLKNNKQGGKKNVQTYGRPYGRPFGRS